MKCPKCKEEMKDISIAVGFAFGSAITRQRMICDNPKCEYYGIPRIDVRNKDFEER